VLTAPDGIEARRRLTDAIAQLGSRLPKIARLLEDAEDDVLAFDASPQSTGPKLRSMFPDDASLIRLVSMLAIEANDEWLVGDAATSAKARWRLSTSHGPIEHSLPDQKRRSPSSPPA
jgi:transposase-like protein